MEDETSWLVFHCYALFCGQAAANRRTSNLVVKGAVGGFLRLRVLLLIPDTDENCRVDVHAHQLLGFKDVH